MVQQRFLNKVVGSRAFYKRLLIIAIPIMVKQGITNFVNMLDNIMVGQIGTEQMSGVAIINQLMFVFNLMIFGGVAGAGIFTAQYYGKGDSEGVRYTFRFKIIICVILSALGFIIMYGLQDNLIMLYLHQGGETGDINLTLKYAKAYLAISLLELLPFAITQVYSGTISECGDTIMPMRAGIVAVFVNLVFNYILIYGKFGAPALGVVGAAIATLISRFVELIIIVIYTHKNYNRHKFIKGAYNSLYIPGNVLKNIIIKGSPLLVNETFWSAGQTILLQNYSIRGLEVIAALNISSTISNVFNIVFIAMGNAIAIILGQELGAGKRDVKYDSYRLTFFAIMICVVSGTLLMLVAPFFPNIYNTEQIVKDLATRFIMVSAFFMPMYAYENAAYFTLRSGGKTVITFLFDACFVWVFSIPLAYVLTHFTSLPILTIFVCCQLIELIKCAIGFILVKKGIWIQTITV
ncbi:MAG: MATE family efflux transporter [Butyrivibrio sp.]|nr:MATE family efflux transporter [Butyrivibrio sp.]